MFPGVDGFHWNAIHIIFLSLFGLVLTTIVVTLTVAASRTILDFRRGRAPSILWRADFEDLPHNERLCRHAFRGAAPGRICSRGFDCRNCETHPKLTALEPGQPVPLAGGLDYPPGRLYHRGHTWVEPQPDGTALIGLDALGASVFGPPDRVELPPVGTKLNMNAHAWKMVRGTNTVNMRAPIDGEVIATGGPGFEWFLRVRPAENQAAFRHLLTGTEVGAWLRAEVDRLEIMVSASPAGATLADGGMLMPDLPKAMPEARWDEVSSAIFLNT